MVSLLIKLPASKAEIWASKSQLRPPKAGNRREGSKQRDDSLSTGQCPCQVRSFY